jgi:phospholipid/cholesterol/gamma-HCH transport system permease protein
MKAIVAFFEAVGRLAIGILEGIGELFLLSFRSVWRMLTPPYGIRDIIQQIELLGVRSLRLALLMALAVGSVLSLQFAYGLAKFGAKDYVGPVVAVALLRELAPVLTALIVGGRIGSGMAAELGSMKVGEQIDAIRALGADPIRKLVVPRLAASLLIMPLLTIFADLVGLIGAALIASSQFDVPNLFFYRTVLDVVVFSDLFSGLLKSLVFGFLVAIIGCYKGFSTSGGTQGVGLSTTGTVEMISISVLVSDFVLTQGLLIIGV